jgi:hypothetical protein
MYTRAEGKPEWTFPPLPCELYAASQAWAEAKTGDGKPGEVDVKASQADGKYADDIAWGIRTVLAFRKVTDRVRDAFVAQSARLRNEWDQPLPRYVYVGTDRPRK